MGGADKDLYRGGGIPPPFWSRSRSCQASFGDSLRHEYLRQRVYMRAPSFL